MNNPFNFFNLSDFKKWVENHNEKEKKEKQKNKIYRPKKKKMQTIN